MAFDLPLTFAFAAAVIFAAASQVVTGFGFAIVLVPLLLFWLEPTQAIALTTALGAALSTIFTLRERAFVRPKQAILLLGTSLLGMPLGIVALVLLPVALLKWLVAAVVLCAIVVVLGGMAFGRSRSANAAAGLLSGVLLTSTAMNGPPLVAVLRAGDYSEREYRATLSAIFCVQGWIGLLMLSMTRKIGTTTLGLAGIGLLALPLGLALGLALGYQALNLLNAKHVKISIVLMLLGCLTKLVWS